MMGIFVSIFSLITVNFNQLNSKNLTVDFILKMNLSLGIITLFIGLIMIFLRKREDNKIMKYFIGLLVIMHIALLIVLSRGIV
ncbi:hypothetical protein ACTQ0C_11410 [Catenibacterium mitsuokai]|uniref:hypothetical protein n=1 Tax=Catenibacterium mitsuokai TaxID=100886 RepID=UPI003F906A7D